MMYDDVMMYLARLNGLGDDIPGASEVKIGNALVQLERWETPFGAPSERLPIVHLMDPPSSESLPHNHWIVRW